MIPNKKKSFTLIELLVVISILAILAGSIVTVYDGLSKKAAKGQARTEIASLRGIIQNYYSLKGRYPSNWDSLLSVPTSLIDPRPIDSYSNANIRRSLVSDNAFDNLSDGILEISDPNHSNINFVSWLSDELLANLQLMDANQRMLDLLVKAGIRSLRYVDQAGDHNSVTPEDLTIRDSSLSGVRIEKSEDIINASKAFENPSHTGTSSGVSGTLRNMGRGFSFYIAADAQNLNKAINLGTGGRIRLPIIIPKKRGSNFLRLGFNYDSTTDIIVALGIGNNCTLINIEEASKDTNTVKSVAGLAKAPIYGDIPRQIYGRYIALFRLAGLKYRGASAPHAMANSSSRQASDAIPNKHLGGEHPARADAPAAGQDYLHYLTPDASGEVGLNPNGGIYDPNDPDEYGIEYEEQAAVFLGVIDCYGNSAKELETQYKQ